jgi:hypothetical protein
MNDMSSAHMTGGYQRRTGCQDCANRCCETRRVVDISRAHFVAVPACRQTVLAQSRWRAELSTKTMFPPLSANGWYHTEVVQMQRH